MLEMMFADDAPQGAAPEKDVSDPVEPEDDP